MSTARGFAQRTTPEPPSTPRRRTRLLYSLLPACAHPPRSEDTVKTSLPLAALGMCQNVAGPGTIFTFGTCRPPWLELVCGGLCPSHPLGALGDSSMVCTRALHGQPPGCPGPLCSWCSGP